MEDKIFERRVYCGIDFLTLFMALCVAISVIVNLHIQMSVDRKRVAIIRDTVYIKQEVEITGPFHYHQFITDSHPLDLKTDDGWYHFRFVNNAK